MYKRQVDPGQAFDDIDDCAVQAGWTTGYSVARDTNNRVTVTTTSEVFALDGTGSQYIIVTR